MSLYSDQGRPGLPLGTKWASNEPFEPLPIDAVEDVGEGWVRQRHMAYPIDPATPGKSVQPIVYYAYTNEDLHPGMIFWARYGFSVTQILVGLGLVAVTGGMVYFATRAKKRR